MTMTTSLARRAKKSANFLDAAKTPETVYCISFFNKFDDTVPKPQNLTLHEFVEQYLKTPKERKTKDGKLFSSATFVEGCQTRKLENVISQQWLGLDYDKQELERILDFWKQSGFTFFYYTTHSHKRKTKDNPNAKPCFRVVLPLADPIPAHLYNALYDWASQQTGGSADEGAKGANRVFYLPAIADEDSEYEYDFFERKLLDWRIVNLQTEQVDKPQAKSVKQTQVAKNSNDDFVLREDAEPPAEKLDDLLEIESNFKTAWNKRIEKFNDDASRYDLSLANHAVNANWSNQEIVDLLVAFRRRHKLTPKSQKNGDAAKYYADTIAKSRTDAAKSKTDVGTPTTKTLLKLNELERQTAIENLQKTLNVPNLAAVIQRGTSNSIYELKLADNTFIVLGSASEVRQPSKVADKLFDAGIILDKISSEKWRDNVLTPIRQIAEIVETLTEAEELHEYIKDYFAYNGLPDGYRIYGRPIDLSNEDKQELVEQLNARKSGFWDVPTGVCYISTGKFIEFLNISSGKRWTQREVTTLLSRHGFRNEQKSIRYVDEKDNVSKVFNAGRFWVSPNEYLPQKL